MTTDLAALFPRSLCNCPVERPTEPMGAYFAAPRCVLDEWHGGDHRDADGNTSPGTPGGALTWWTRWASMWRQIAGGAR